MSENFCKGFIKCQALGKLTSCEEILAAWFDHQEECSSYKELFECWIMLSTKYIPIQQISVIKTNHA